MPRVVLASVAGRERETLSGSAESRESVQFRRAISRVNSVAYCNVEEAGVCSGHRTFVVCIYRSIFNVSGRIVVPSRCGNQETDRPFTKKVNKTIY